MNEDNILRFSETNDYTAAGETTFSVSMSGDGTGIFSGFISTDHGGILNFNQIRQFQPSNYFCTHEGELYQLWYCNYSGNKKWKKVPTSEVSDFPFQEGEFLE